MIRLKSKNPATTGMLVRGFTLIELLVVIAIIAILAAILFPVFAQAREKARQTSCLSNEKQIALGIIQYVQDYDEVFPFAWASDATYGRNSWPQKVQPYMKSLAVFRCPTDSADVPSYVNGGTFGVAISYAANGSVYTGPNRLIGVISTIPADINNAPNGFWFGTDLFRSLADVPRPAEGILLGERHSDDIQKAKGYWMNANASDWGQTSVFMGQYNFYGNQGSDPAPTQSPEGTRTANAVYPYGPNGSVSARHSTMSNFAFCDGHVKAMKPAATNPNPATRPQDNMWDTTRK